MAYDQTEAQMVIVCPASSSLRPACGQLGPAIRYNTYQIHPTLRNKPSRCSRLRTSEKATYQEFVPLGVAGEYLEIEEGLEAQYSGEAAVQQMRES
jgi:hypothetical protein